MLFHLQPSPTQIHLYSIVLQFYFEIDGIGVLRVQNQTPVVTLPADGIDLNVDLAAFINVSDQRVDKDAPRKPPKNNVSLSDPAEMDVVI